MLNRKSIFLGFLLFFVSDPSFGQRDTLSLEEQLAQLELELDSLLIFNLLDSILASTPTTSSELGFRVSYNNNILNFGRSFGLNQHGIAPGIAYYHKSGFFSDISGFWGSAFEPKYNLTVATVGYMKLLGKNWSLTSNYERWIYNYESTNPANSLGITATFSSKYLYQSFDYSFLFGNSTSHRMISTTSGNFKKNNIWIFNSITFYPNVSFVFGNETITVKFSDAQKQTFEYQQYLRENLDREEFVAFLNTVEISEEDRNHIQRISLNRQLTREEKVRRINHIYLQYQEVIEYLNSQFYTTEKAYGIMNCGISLPITFRINQFSFTTNYTYSIPIRLPGEIGELNPVGYFGLSVSYRLPIR